MSRAIHEETWQLKRLDTGEVGPVVGKFLVGCWSRIDWTLPVRDGVDLTWDEYEESCVP